MTALIDALKSVHRPRLLVRAARYGLEDYNRNRDLKRILRQGDLPAPSAALPRLIEMEEAQEETRQIGDASYSIARHLEVLIALMAEARLLRGGMSQA